MSSWPPDLKCPFIIDCNVSNRVKYLPETALPTEDIFVYFHHSPGGNADIQFLHRKFRCANSKCAPERFILDENRQFCGKIAGIARLKEETPFAVFDQFGSTADAMSQPRSSRKPLLPGARSKTLPNGSKRQRYRWCGETAGPMAWRAQTRSRPEVPRRRLLACNLGSSGPLPTISSFIPGFKWRTRRERFL